MSDAAEKVMLSIRIDLPLYEFVRKKSEAEQRSMNQVVSRILQDAEKRDSARKKTVQP